MIYIALEIFKHLMPYRSSLCKNTTKSSFTRASSNIYNIVFFRSAKTLSWFYWRTQFKVKGGRDKCEIFARA